MPDLTPEALMKLKPSKRWPARMNHAWFECRDIRPKDAAFYTKHTLIVEEPDPTAAPINVGTEAEPVMVHPVVRYTDNSKGVIQIWRPGKGPKGALHEVSDGVEWHGYKAVVTKSNRYEDCLKAVQDLLSKFDKVRAIPGKVQLTPTEE